MESFIPTYSSIPNYRSGLKRIPFSPKNLWGRFLRWWRGEPVAVNAMILFGEPQFLYVATDKGLFYMGPDAQILKPVPFSVQTSGVQP